MKVSVISEDNKLFVQLSPEFKKPYWADTMYYGKYQELEDGSIKFPCRDCNVTITKPTVIQTPMGLAQSQQSYVEKWVYFDVPELSLLVKEGEDILETWTMENLKLELKEEIPSIEEKKEEENV